MVTVDALAGVDDGDAGAKQVPGEAEAGGFGQAAEGERAGKAEAEGIPEAVVAGEKEGPVATDRTTEAGGELVAAELGLALRVEVVAGVEVVVAMEVGGGAVEIVRAAEGGGIDDGAGEGRAGDITNGAGDGCGEGGPAAGYEKSNEKETARRELRVLRAGKMPFDCSSERSGCPIGLVLQAFAIGSPTLRTEVGLRGGLVAYGGKLGRGEFTIGLDA